MQSVLEDARFTPFATTAFAVPSVWVRQPVPVQLLATSVTAERANPLVAAWHTPAAAHVAVAFPRTVPPAATVSVVDEVLVAQPDFVPLSHMAATWADVETNRLASSTVGAVSTVADAALTCAWHAVLPSQVAEPLAVLWLLRPSCCAFASAVPVTRPTQPASGQRIVELD
ncbi:MAG TPA: hypothetical protein VKZ81_08545 [Pseudonocardia sp.]|uniref:hypothetical protein n=1 Tax=Pseudonocardia sp. TaxID=60912 RepID=UPI002B4AC8F4|nr:hypothetical protein [Pseudonocardia sp.]HLU55499.1 hypothetical protein [Pseudonocardia sp.]